MVRVLSCNLTLVQLINNFDILSLHASAAFQFGAVVDYLL